MKNIELKIARTQNEQALIRDLVNNPVIEILVAYIVIEALQKQGLMPALAGTLAEGGILTAVACQQLAPIVPDLVHGGGDIAKAIPAITALARV